MSRGSTLAAVPILVHALGVDLYAVWVLASTAVFAQGLVDFGCSAAVVRFVAVAKAEESRHSATVVIARATLFYLLLSLLAVILWLAAPAIAEALPYVVPSAVRDAEVLLRYTAVAFVVTNLTVLMSAALQGLGRVDVAYRSQTLGAATYLPLLILGVQLLPDAHAVGASLVGMYGAELLLAGLSLVRELPRTGDALTAAPSVSAMFKLGVQWQLSGWSDFATFQLPRIIAAVGANSRSVLIIDLALRYGQAITAPLFAFYPVVLPSATATWLESGREGVRALIERYLRRGAAVVLLGAALLIPLAAPVIEVWTGVEISALDAAVAMVVALGVVAYASTGLFSAAMLAMSDLRDVMRYKGAQLFLALTLLAVASAVGGAAVGAALAVALLGPAVWFVRRAVATLGADLRGAAAGGPWPLGILAVTASAFLGAHDRVPAALLLAVGCGLLATAIFVGRGHLRGIVHPAPTLQREPSPGP